jgi:GNAT superfamily N-acetyltransferase
MADIEYSETKPDAGRYLALFKTTGWNDVYKVGLDELGKALNNSWYVVTAYQRNELVGIGRVVSDGVLYAMIYDIIVKPSYQGMGIGTTILNKLIEKCRSAGVRDIQLFSAKGKAQFYNKRDFVERPADAPGMRLKKDQISE